MKKLAFVFAVLMVVSGVLAEISISEPEKIYNLGDRLYVELDGIRGVENGNLDINLRCGNESVNMVRIPARAFSSDEDQSYSIPYKVLDWNDLGILDLGSIIGSCQVVALIGGKVATGKVFEISDEVEVEVSLDKDSYNPGETVMVDVSAVFDNGMDFDGYAEGVNGTLFSEEFVEGVAASSFVIGETVEAGVYLVKIRAYDVGSGGIMNEGEGIVPYVVNQVPTSLVLSLADVVAMPGENFSVGVNVFDQAGVEMSGSIEVKLISSEGDEVESGVSSGEFFGVDFPTNASLGYWKIVATFDDLSVEREFEMGGLQKVEFDFEEDVLVVRNVGNVLYNKTINVKIGDDVRRLELNIGKGESRKFSLKAPGGKYSVVVGDGEEEVVREVLLTGNAISVKDFKDFSFSMSSSLLWLFLIVAFGAVGSVLVFRYKKTRKIGSREEKGGNWSDKILGGLHLKKRVAGVRKKVPREVREHLDETLTFTKKSPAVQGLDSENYSCEDHTMMDFTRKNVSTAESALVMKGEKHASSVVAINIKNFGEVGEHGRNSLVGIVEEVKGKGLVDYRGDYAFVIFNPLVTRTYSNEKLAVNCGMKIVEKLLAYNRKFRDKIEFGVGVHSGDLVASRDGGKLKYTGIGNTISFAKRMSDIDSGKVVVSEEVRKKMIRDLKASKGKEISGKVTYVVDSIADRSGDAEKLRELLKRQNS